MLLNRIGNCVLICSNISAYKYLIVKLLYHFLDNLIGVRPIRLSKMTIQPALHSSDFPYPMAKINSTIEKYARFLHNMNIPSCTQKNNRNISLQIRNLVPENAIAA